MSIKKTGAIGGVNRIIQDSGEKFTRGPGLQLMSTGRLTGDKVVDARNDHLGKIEEIMLDVPRGRIAYAVIACGGILGMGEKLFAIPWQALTMDADDEYFVLNMGKESLERAPGFNQDHWPSMTDPQWAASIHDYYGCRPYWE